MITHKSHIAKKPFKKTFAFRKSHWYLFPQRWTWRKSVAEINYEGNVDGYRHRYFWLIYAYQFSWLFIDIHWELDTSERLSESIVRHEPLNYLNQEGQMFKL